MYLPTLAMTTPARPFVKKVAQHTVVWDVIKATTRNQLLGGQHEPRDFQLDAATSILLGIVCGVQHSIGIGEMQERWVDDEADKPSSSVSEC